MGNCNAKTISAVSGDRLFMSGGTSSRYTLNAQSQKIK